MKPIATLASLTQPTTGLSTTRLALADFAQPAPVGALAQYVEAMAHTVCRGEPAGSLAQIGIRFETTAKSL